MLESTARDFLRRMQATEYHCDRYRDMSNAEVWGHARAIHQRFKALDWTNRNSQMLVLEEMRYVMLVLMDRLAEIDPEVAAWEREHS